MFVCLFVCLLPLSGHQNTIFPVFLWVVFHFCPDLIRSSPSPFLIMGVMTYLYRNDKGETMLVKRDRSVCLTVIASRASKPPVWISHFITVFMTIVNDLSMSEWQMWNRVSKSRGPMCLNVISPQSPKPSKPPVWVSHFIVVFITAVMTYPCQDGKKKGTHGCYVVFGAAGKT